ncbi:MAG TPA: hypothetical protein VGQ81_06890 [Acidobacteriota bacterium]|jgi:hypothetical protein|nr:hypothetical protein [Acidobacteriota bacterium]
MNTFTLCLAAVVLFVAVAAPLPQNEPASAQAILEKAMRAAGGAANLSRFVAFHWKGEAVVHAGDRVIPITGEWYVQPPDRAWVRTEDQLSGTKSSRLMVIDRGRGWMQMNGKTQTMEQEFLDHELEQFYLYYLMRLAPLRDKAFHVSLLHQIGKENLETVIVGATKSELSSFHLNPLGLHISHAGHQDVELFFDRLTGLLVKAITRRTDPTSGKEVRQELLLTNYTLEKGVRWPRKLTIFWDNRPYFELKITEFAPLKKLDDKLFEKSGQLSANSNQLSAVSSQLRAKSRER